MPFARAQAKAPVARPEPPPLLSTYAPLADHFDEMIGADGELRSHWEYPMRSLEALGAGELGQRHEQVRQLLYENGVTYNVYDDPQRGERLWPLDPLPVLFPSSEWSVVEQGLIQRAEVFDLLLADLYGPRRLLRSGVLPAEIVFAHPGFLLPCIDTIAARGSLQLYGADLGRLPDGQFRVLGDRTQAPSGMGYALENRTLLSRIFPSLYRDSHVHRLALFFRGLRANLMRLAKPRDETPRIVLLTPGEENETYFEHVFLANYLGYGLVQGSDLVVYDDCVWLKTLDGHRRVDVILRRVDDAYCDPLELRADSVLGTPGLLQAARLGNVVIANPLGSSVLENPALMAYLPRICRELLDEDLKLESVATWWCGVPQDLSYVLENLEHLVVKPIVPHASAVTAFGPTLAAADREALAARIRAQPYLFVGQAQLPLSTAPSLSDGGIEPRPMVLRGFVAVGGSEPLVLPGGLCRVAPSRDSLLVSNQRGGVSKDLWVLASEPERQVTLLKPMPEAVALKRDGDEVPGRVADDLFWLGRYAERTESNARLLREIYLRLLGSERAPQDDALPLLLQGLAALTGLSLDLPGSEPVAGFDPEPVLRRILSDRTQAGTLRFNIEALVRAGRSVRDRLSSDATRVITALSRECVAPLNLAAGLESLQRVVMLHAAFAGLCSESMTRGQGWSFLELGRHLERAADSAAVLRTVAVPALEGGAAPWEALLAVAHSVKTYRRRYRAQAQPLAVIDLLLFDETNPRSLAHQLARLQQLVVAIDRDGMAQRSSIQRLALEAYTTLRLAHFETLQGDEVQRLGQLLQQLRWLMGALSDEMTRRYFAGTDTPQQLVRVA